MLFIELECVPQFWVRKMGMAWGPRGVASPVLGDPPDALEVPEGQPFFLHLLARSLKTLGDPDFGILVNGEECFAKGVQVGYDAPLPRASGQGRSLGNWMKRSSSLRWRTTLRPRCHVISLKHISGKMNVKE